jgi:hypothetical protein
MYNSYLDRHDMINSVMEVAAMMSSVPNQTGPGRRSVHTLHKDINKTRLHPVHRHQAKGQSKVDRRFYMMLASAKRQRKMARNSYHMSRTS